MTTLLQYHTAVMNGPDANRALNMLRRLCSGTTSLPADQRVIWVSGPLALVATDYGAKQIVVVDAPRDTSRAEDAAMRRLFPHGPEDRLSPSAIREWIAKLGNAAGVWTAVVAEEQAKIAAANAAQSERNERYAKRIAARKALLVSMLRAKVHAGTDTATEDLASEWLAEIEKEG